ncbi:MAG: hypothetical protein OES79_11515 [Planctomycetota bacterium]|nr:hypothetical protein [Planctomycetota bacterium]
MTQSEIDRAVARATGESVSTIKEFGFGISEPGIAGEAEPSRGPHVVNWDELDAQRVSLRPSRRRSFAAD